MTERCPLAEDQIYPDSSVSVPRVCREQCGRMMLKAMFPDEGLPARRQDEHCGAGLTFSHDLLYRGDQTPKRKYTAVNDCLIHEDEFGFDHQEFECPNDN